MNYIKHLTGFFDKVMRDDRLNPTHISLYISLFQFWNVQRFKNPISISRDEVMRVSKICSKATYHKCMRDLHNFSYLNYDPSFNPYRGSLITLFDLELKPELVQKKARVNPQILTHAEQALNSQQAGAEQDLVPYINSLNKTNKLNKTNGHEFIRKKNTSKSSSADHIDTSEKEKKEIPETFAGTKKNNSGGGQKLRQNKKGSESESVYTAGERFIRPLLLNVQAYFIQKNWPILEAEKFFNHYQSNGWLVGGKSPMQSWEASASNWIINAQNFKHANTKDKPKPGNLHATTGKDYGEPL